MTDAANAAMTRFMNNSKALKDAVMAFQKRKSLRIINKISRYRMGRKTRKTKMTHKKSM